MCSTFKECWLQKMTHLGLNSCFIRLCSETSLSIIFIFCKMGIKQDTCVQSLLQGIKELTHAMCPVQAQSKFTVHIVSIIIIIMIFIITINIIIIIVVFIMSESGSQIEERSKTPRHSTIKLTRWYHFSRFSCPEPALLAP